MDTTTSKISISDVLKLMENPETSEHSLRQYLVEDESASDAFAPALKFNPETVDTTELDNQPLARGSSFLRLFNTWAREKRQRRFHRKILQGYDGPVLVSEGDSWFQYPVRLDDVIDCLSERYAVMSLGAAADTLSGMLKQDEFIDAIHEVNADLFLLSGGGNDLFGDERLKQYVRPFDSALSAEQYLLPAFDVFLNQILDQYLTIIQRVRSEAEGVHILLHAYDQAIPDNQKWLGKPMIDMGIVDPSLQKSIVGEIFTRFATSLQLLAQRIDQVHFVDAMGTVEGRWHDELHPTDEGFKSVASVYTDLIDSLVTRGVITPGSGSRGQSRGQDTELSPEQNPEQDGRQNEDQNRDQSRVQASAQDSSSRVNVSSVTQAVTQEAKGYSLHIGVNLVDPDHYAGWDGELLACEFDAESMHEIAEQNGYSESTRLLTQEATRDNVTGAIREIAGKMKPDDKCFISYAGHGSYLPDLNHDEQDGTDETWCLYDSQLLDDELYDLWHLFPAGCRILLVSDSCHSGSVARAGQNGQLMRISNDASVADASPYRPRAMPYQLASRVYRTNRSQYDRRLRQAGEREFNNSELKATVRLLSGCQDNQQSKDGPFNGVFTARLLAVWRQGGYTGNYTQFHKEICRGMPSDQSPNHQRHGAEHRFFDEQQPFVI